ncbi:uncharacterized protein LOC143180796 [Calliopsis andreniformis]|uniref:uncharacterized protein LOC143180796 n=1 Tax=Calliopsis andreniformis TaxID=337506 RepID=UPI003FCC5215
MSFTAKSISINTLYCSQPISSVIADCPGLTAWRLLRVETYRERMDFGIENYGGMSPINSANGQDWGYACVEQYELSHAVTRCLPVSSKNTRMGVWQAMLSNTVRHSFIL